MVVVEVEAAVLDGGEAGDAFGGDGGDVFAGLGGADEFACADGLERLGDGAQPRFEGRLAGEVDSGGMAGSGVGLDGADMVGEVGGVVLGVGLRLLASLPLRTSRR